MSFATRLKVAMNERNISQKELAAAIDKGKSSVSQYLSGRSIPRLDVQEKIAEVLDCTMEWLNSEISTDDKTKTGLKNISIAQAAKMLGKGEQFIRIGLQNGTIPFGFAVKNKKRWSYHISPKKLNDYISERW